jgi:hypothetical protein
MMIDLHSHILPELDDGAQNLHQSLEMAHIAIQSGVTTMVATPHCVDGRSEDVRSMLKLMRSVLREHGLRLQLCSGVVGRTPFQVRGRDVRELLLSILGIPGNGEDTHTPVSGDITQAIFLCMFSTCLLVLMLCIALFPFC